MFTTRFMTRSRDHRVTRRIGVLLLAVAQLLGPLGLQVVDAVDEGHQFGTAAQIECEGHGCGDGHDFLLCQTVRAMAASLLSADLPGAVAVAANEFSTPEEFGASITPDTYATGSLGSRAPPLA